MKKLNMGLRKFLKGMLGIFMIKLVVLSVVLIYQSCENSEIIKDDLSSKNFNQAISKTRSKLSKVKVYDKKDLENLDLNVKSEEGGLTEVNMIKTNPDEEINDILTFDKLAYLIENGIVILDKDDTCVQNNGYELCEVSYIDEDLLYEAFEPAAIASVDFLKSKGLNDSDINEILDGHHSANLIPIIMEVTRHENNNSAAMNFNYGSLFGTSSYAQSAVRDCFMETTGIAAGAALVAALTAQVLDKTLVKRLFKKAVKKIGLRTLGGIGLAWMIIDFTYCVATYEDA